MNREILFGGKKEGKDWEVIGNIYDTPGIDRRDKRWRK